jgi:superfamily II DNA or RNA helicase
MITLREYQSGIIDKLRNAYKTGKKSPLVVSPTGSGKTVMFAFVAARHTELKGRVLILVHRSELVEQVVDTLAEYGISPGIIAAGYDFQPWKNVQVASVFTLIRRLHKIQPPTLIVVDEAHHATRRTTWGKIIAAYPTARVLGVTATPIRLSGEGLGDIFDDLIIGPDTNSLIELGALSPVTVYAPKEPDLSSLKKVGGDYDQRQLARLFDRSGITGDVLQHYRRLTPGRQAVAFCVSVEHARHVASQFAEAGVHACAIDGGTGRDIRRTIVRDFRERRIQLLASCDLISEGFDCPGIEVGISLRPTASVGLWLQQVGRCLRTSPGKERAVILDHAGNTYRHGLPTDERDWSLDGISAGAKRDGEGPKHSIRVCPNCFAANKSTAECCRSCGQAFPVAPRKVKALEGELEEISPQEAAERKAAKEARQAQGQAQSLQALIELGTMRGYKNPAAWASHIFNARQSKRRSA